MAESEVTVLQSRQPRTGAQEFVTGYEMGWRLSARSARALSLALRELIDSRFEGLLAGSWRTEEAHFPPRFEGIVRSFSDVDVLINRPPDAGQALQIAAAVRTLADSYGVAIAKVSVRSRAEIEGFWHPDYVDRMATHPQHSGRYLLFWALVGAIEALSSPAGTCRCGRSYLAVKFFFKLARNMLLFQGVHPGTYRALASAVSASLVPHAAVQRAYVLKLGRMPLFNTTAADWDVLLSPSTWARLARRCADPSSADAIAALVADIRAWHRSGILPKVGHCLEMLADCCEVPALVPAYSKVLLDYDRHRASGIYP